MDICLNRATLPLGASAGEVVRAGHLAGFRYIEMSARRLSQAVQEDRRAREIIHSGDVLPIHGGWSIRLHWDTERFTAALPQVAREMEFVAGLGSRSGALVLPRRSVGSPSSIGREELLDRVRRVCGLALANGLGVALEFNGLQRSSALSEECSTLAEAIEFVQQSACSNAGVLLDSFHWHASGGTAEELQAMTGCPVMFVHINDAPDMPHDELDDTLRLLPGRGVIDLGGLVSALEQQGYSRPLSVELKHPELHAMDPVSAARVAFTAAQQIFETSE